MKKLKICNPPWKNISDSDNPALMMMIFVENNPVPPQWDRTSTQMQQKDWGASGWTYSLLSLLALTWLHKDTDCPLEEGSYQGIADRFAFPAGIWIISARIWVFIWSLGRGMLTSLVSDTVKGLFAERKPFCGWVGLSSWLYTQGKHQRDVDEVKQEIEECVNRKWNS